MSGTIANNREKEALVCLSSCKIDHMGLMFYVPLDYKHSRDIVLNLIKRKFPALTTPEAESISDLVTNQDFGTMRYEKKAFRLETFINKEYERLIKEAPPYELLPICTPEKPLNYDFNYGDLEIVPGADCGTEIAFKIKNVPKMLTKGALHRHSRWVATVGLGFIRSFLVIEGVGHYKISLAEEGADILAFTNRYLGQDNCGIKVDKTEIFQLSCWEKIFGLISECCPTPAHALLDFSKTSKMMEQSRGAFYLFNSAVSDPDEARAILLMTSALESISNEHKDKDRCPECNSVKKVIAGIIGVLEQITAKDPLKFFLSDSDWKSQVKKMYNLRSLVTHGSFDHDTLKQINDSIHTFRRIVAKFLIYYSFIACAKMKNL